jgi:hypothetical protein
MLFRETAAVYCENQMEHTNALCAQNVGFWCVKAGGTYSGHCSLCYRFVPWKPLNFEHELPHYMILIKKNFLTTWLVKAQVRDETPNLKTEDEYGSMAELWLARKYRGMLEKGLPQYHLVHQESRLKLPGIKPEARRWEESN